MINNIHISELYYYASKREWLDVNFKLLNPTISFDKNHFLISRNGIKDYDEKKHKFGNNSKVLITNWALLEQMDIFILEHMEVALEKYKTELKNVGVCFFYEKSGEKTNMNIYRLFPSEKE